MLGHLLQSQSVSSALGAAIEQLCLLTPAAHVTAPSCTPLTLRGTCRQCGLDNGYDEWGLGPVLYGSVLEWIFQVCCDCTSLSA